MSPTEKILDLAARASIERPWIVLGAAALVTAASLAVLPHARITSDVAGLLPDDLEEVRTFREAEGSFEESNLLLVLLASDRPGRLEALSGLAEAWAARLEGSDLVRRVEVRADEGMDRFLDEVFSRSFPLFLAPERVEDLIEALSDDEIRRRVAASRSVLRSSPAGSLRVKYDPLGLWEIVAGDLAGGAGTFEIDVGSGFLVTPDHRNLIFIVHGKEPPARLEYGKRLVAAVREAEMAARAEVGGRAGPPGADVGDGDARDAEGRPGGSLDGIESLYTGGYALALGDERTIRRDLGVTILTSLIGVHLIFVLAFRRLRALVFVGLPLALGILWTFAAFVLVHGREIVSGTAAFSAILVGLGIDFAIHALHRFEREVDLGATTEEAIRTAVIRTGSANLAAALTTAAAFGAFLVTRIPGVSQTGLFAGMGILLCLVSMTTVMPALIRVIGPGRRDRPLPGLGLPRLARSLAERPRTYIAGCAAATAAAILLGGPRIPGIELETDARNLRPEGEPAVEALRRIEEAFGGAFSHVRLVVRGRDEEEVLRRAEGLGPALRGLVDDDVIASYASPTRVLPSAGRQAEAAQLLRERLPPGRPAAIVEALRENGYRPEAFEEGIARLASALEAPPPVTRARIEEVGLGPLLDRHIRRTETGAVGVIHLFPKANLWDGRARAAWVAAVEARIPRSEGELTGLILLAQVLARVLHDDFLVAAGLALLAIAAITSVTFRRPRAIALALLPVIIGATWMVCGMALLGIRLNYMNIAIFPLVFGLGVDDGIHLVHRMREGTVDLDGLLRGTGRAILLTSLTTLVGFGSLILADHRGVASLGRISILGISACLVTSLLILPPLLGRLASAERSAG